jgi:hypothetical protein
MTEHEQNLRDLAAMFAMAGLIMNGENYSMPEVADKAHKIAAFWMEARNPTQEGGIADITPKRKYGRKTVD